MKRRLLFICAVSFFLVTTVASPNGSRWIHSVFQVIITGATKLSGSVSVGVAAQSASPYGTQVGTFGALCDEVSVGSSAISSGSRTLTSSVASWANGDVGKSILVPGADAAGAALISTISGVTDLHTITLADPAATSVTNKKAWYGTDNTSHFNSAIAAVMAIGGTLVVPSGTCLVAGQIILPNSGASNTVQSSLRITGQSTGADGSWAVKELGGTTLDMWYSSGSPTDGKIVSLGLGQLEIDHMMLRDNGSDTTPFIYITNTTLKFHNNRIIGTNKGSQGVNGQDALVLGGTTTTVWTNDPIDAFQGYGTVIDSNFFDYVSRVVYLRTYANAVQIVNNTVSSSCAGIAPIELYGGPATNEGNYIAGNLIELANYQYLAKLTKAFRNTFVANSGWDQGGGFLSWFNCTSSTANMFIMGENTAVHNMITGDGTASDNSLIDGRGSRITGTGVSCADTNNDLGKLWFDTGSSTTVMKVCMYVSGTLQWVTK